MIGKLLEGIRIAGDLNRRSSDRLVNLAQRALRHPETLTEADIKSLAASVLSQSRPGPMRDSGDAR